MPTYSASGLMNVTLSNGSGFKGTYAPDGSQYVTEVPIDARVPEQNPDGSLNITESPGTSPVGLYAPNGAVYYTTNINENSGAMKVVSISGNLNSFWVINDTGAYVTGLTGLYTIRG